MEHVSGTSQMNCFHYW